MKIEIIRKIVGIAACAVLSTTTCGITPYVSFHGGWALQSEADAEGKSRGQFTATGASEPIGFDFDTKYSAEYEDGFVIEGAAGVAYDFLPIRTELAFLWQQNNVGEVKGDDFRLTEFNLDQDMWAGMVNIYYDFENPSPITPFVMAGLGFAWIELDSFERNLTTGMPEADVTTKSEIDDTVFMAQFGVGLSYAISENIVFDLRYKYLIARDAELDFTGNVAGDDAVTINGQPVPGALSFSGTHDVEIAAHQVQAGIRYMF